MKVALRFAATDAVFVVWRKDHDGKVVPWATTTSSASAEAALCDVKKTLLGGEAFLGLYVRVADSTIRSTSDEA
jgi:hypothetical protein